MGAKVDAVFRLRDDRKLGGDLQSLIEGQDVADEGDGWIACLKPEEQVVELVLYSWGVMSNGGFQYLFEGTSAFYGPEIARSYDAIGMPEIGDVFRRFVQLVGPGPREIEGWELAAREAILKNTDWVRAAESQFYKACDRIPGLVANYARAHRAAFAHLG